MNCFFCGAKVIWQCDYSFEDFMLEGEGIISTHTCCNCNAVWEGYLPLEEDEDKQDALFS